MDNDSMIALRQCDPIAYSQLKQQNNISRNQIKSQVQDIIGRLINTALVMDYSLTQEERNNMGYYILDIFTEVIKQMDTREKLENNNQQVIFKGEQHDD